MARSWLPILLASLISVLAQLTGDAEKAALVVAAEKAARDKAATASAAAAAAAAAASRAAELSRLHELTSPKLKAQEAAFAARRAQEAMAQQAQPVASVIPMTPPIPGMPTMPTAAAHEPLQAQEQLTAEREEIDRMAKEKAEADRLVAEKMAEERLAVAAAEAERLAAETAEAEKAEAEKAEAERAAAAETERLAAETAEAERLAAEDAEAKRLDAERLAERVAAEKAKVEAERLAAEKAKAERMTLKEVDIERLAAKTAAEAASPEVITAAGESEAAAFAESEAVAAMAAADVAATAMPAVPAASADGAPVASAEATPEAMPEAAHTDMAQPSSMPAAAEGELVPDEAVWRLNVDAAGGTHPEAMRTLEEELQAQELNLVDMGMGMDEAAAAMLDEASLAEQNDGAGSDGGAVPTDAVADATAVAAAEPASSAAPEEAAPLPPSPSDYFSAMAGMFSRPSSTNLQPTPSNLQPASLDPPPASTDPPPASTDPPAASTDPPAASTDPPAASPELPAASPELPVAEVPPAYPEVPAADLSAASTGAAGALPMDSGAIPSLGLTSLSPPPLPNAEIGLLSREAAMAVPDAETPSLAPEWAATLPAEGAAASPPTAEGILSTFEGMASVLKPMADEEAMALVHAETVRLAAEKAAADAAAAALRAEAEALARAAAAAEAARVAALPPCVDEVRECATWAASMECVSNPIFMNSKCRKSCGKCPTQNSPPLSSAPPVVRDEPLAPVKAAEAAIGVASEAVEVAAVDAEEERLSKEQAAAQKVEADRVAAAEAERLAAEQLEAHRVWSEKAEAERREAEGLAAKKAEEERMAAKKAEEEERVAAEKAEAARLEAEKAAADAAAAALKAEAEALARAAAESDAARLAALPPPPPSRLSLWLGAFTSQLGQLDARSAALVMLSSAGGLMTVSLLLESPDAQLTIGVAAARALLVSVDTAAALLDHPTAQAAPVAPVKACTPLHEKATASADIITGVVGDDGSGAEQSGEKVRQGSSGEVVLDGAATAKGCTPLCALLEQVLIWTGIALAHGAPSSSGFVWTRLGVLAESLLLLAAARFYTGAGEGRSASARHRVLLLLLLLSSLEPSEPSLTQLPPACSVGAALLPSMLLAFFALVRRGRLVWAALFLGLALAARPLLLLLVPLALFYFLAAASSKRHALLLVLITVSTPLVSIPACLSAVGAPGGAGPVVLLRTLMPPELWPPPSLLAPVDDAAATAAAAGMATPVGPASPFSVWAASPLLALLQTAPGEWNKVDGTWQWTVPLAAADALPVDAAAELTPPAVAALVGPVLLGALTLLGAIQAARYPTHQSLLSGFVLVGAAAIWWLPHAAPHVLPLLSPLLALAAPESRTHARAYLLLCISIHASSLHRHLEAAGSPVGSTNALDSALGLSSAFGVRMLARLGAAAMALLLSHSSLQMALPPSPTAGGTATWSTGPSLFTGGWVLFVALLLTELAASAYAYLGRAADVGVSLAPGAVWAAAATSGPLSATDQSLWVYASDVSVTRPATAMSGASLSATLSTVLPTARAIAASGLLTLLLLVSVMWPSPVESESPAGDEIDAPSGAVPGAERPPPKQSHSNGQQQQQQQQANGGADPQHTAQLEAQLAQYAAREGYYAEREAQYGTRDAEMMETIARLQEQLAAVRAGGEGGASAHGNGAVVPVHGGGMGAQPCGMRSHNVAAAPTVSPRMARPYGSQAPPTPLPCELATLASAAPSPAEGVAPQPLRAPLRGVFSPAQGASFASVDAGVAWAGIGGLRPRAGSPTGCGRAVPGACAAPGGLVVTVPPREAAGRKVLNSVVSFDPSARVVSPRRSDRAAAPRAAEGGTWGGI